MMLLPLALCAAGSAPASAGGNPNEKYPFDIAPGEAAYRLNDFSTQSGLQLLFGFEDMKGIPITPVRGKLKPFDALDRMIAGTKIRYEFINRRTVTLTLRPVQAAESLAPSKHTDEELYRASWRDRRAPSIELEEITILTAPVPELSATGSTLISLNRTEIDALGTPTVPGVISTLPQVFGGGPTEDTRRIGFEARTNAAYGNGINLRGLGASSTLVLMNGRRLAGSGSEGLFVDVSNLPLAALERIDVLPDSSSTFYGADAVGGVVNFVMRDRFDGAQSEAHYGTATRGLLSQEYVSQIVGGHTDTSRGLLAFDFYSRDNIPAASRELARSDLRPFGGSNFDLPQSNPGNIVLGSSTWAIPAGQDGSSLEAADLHAGAPNLANQLAGADLLPSQQRWSAFATGHQNLGERVTLFSDLLVSQRQVRNTTGPQVAAVTVPVSNPFYVNPTGVPGPVTVSYSFLDDMGPLLSSVRVNATDFTGGLSVELGSWHLTGSAGYATERTHSNVENVVDPVELNKALAQTDRANAFNPFGDGSHTSAAVLASLRTEALFTARSNVLSGGALASGPIANLPGGKVKLSVGADARGQSFESTTQGTSTALPISADLSRSIHSGFAELKVPIFGPSNRRRGLESLDVSLAERYEHYSDFGGTLAARLGVAWEPLKGIRLRSSYSESFRPPGLVDQDESSNSYAFVPLRDPQTGAFSNVLIWVGKNRDLQEESARSWTAGFEFEPVQYPGAALALTYFDTELTNRLSRPTPSANLLTDSTRSALITRDPTATYRAEVCSRAPQANTTIDCLTAPIAAIADLRVRNDAAMLTRGFDLLGRYSRDSRFGRFSLGLNGTYILEFSEAQTRSQPLENRVSTPNYPVNLRLRSSAGWQRSSWEVFAYANYLNSYLDTVSVPRRHVTSWTTLDLNIAYSLRGAAQSVLGDTTVSLSAENVFDTDPPFLNNAVGIGYDQENGDLTGRVVSLTVRKKW